MSSLINTLVKEHEQFKKEFTAKAQNAMRATFTEFFDANPEIDQICWTQYTPYFNDGDKCIFGVNDMFFTLGIEETDLEDASYEDDDESCYGSSFYSYKDDNTVDPVATHRAAFKAFKGVVQKLPDEIYKDAFGDHVKVIATRKGFHVEEYEHD